MINFKIDKIISCEIINISTNKKIMNLNNCSIDLTKSDYKEENTVHNCHGSYCPPRPNKYTKKPK